MVRRLRPLSYRLLPALALVLIAGTASLAQVPAVAQPPSVSRPPDGRRPDVTQPQVTQPQPVQPRVTRPPGVNQPVVTGVVVDGSTGAPVAGAEVASGADAVAADDAGRFAVTLGADDDRLQVSADGYLDTDVPLDPSVRAGAELEVLLFGNTFAETVEVVSAEAVPERPSATPIEAEEVFQVAGSLDNIFRTLDALPGVASTGDFGSRLAVRGGTPDQNLTIMDGVEVHNPYRLFGLVSAFNPETVDRFELTAGGFGAAYGDRLSSLLIVDNRPGETDLGGSSSTSVTDANVVLEGAAPGNGSWLVSGRRTYYDLVAGIVTDQNLPSFADLQLQAGWDFGPGHRLSLLGLTSRENADFRFDDEDDPAGDSGGLVSESGNDLGSLRFDAVLGSAATSRTILSWYRNTEVLGVNATFDSASRRSNAPDDETAVGRTNLAFDRSLSVRDVSLRQELGVELSPAHTLDAGIELHRLTSGVALSITGDRNESVANPSSVRGGVGLPDALDSVLRGTRGGAWIQDRYQVTPRLLVEPGLRLEWSTVNGDAVLSPRFAATLALGWESRLRVAGGLYAQSPGYEKLIQSDYFFDLSPGRIEALRHERATHVVAGFEKDVRRGHAGPHRGPTTRRSTTMSRRPPRDRGGTPRAGRRVRASRPTCKPACRRRARITSTPVNGGRGEAYGIDAYLVRKRTGRSTVGLALVRLGARRPGGRTGCAIRSSTTGRHAFNVVGRYRLGDPLERGGDGAGGDRLPLHAGRRGAGGFGGGRTGVGSCRHGTLAAHWSTRSTAAGSRPCSAVNCRTTGGSTCASPTSRAAARAAGRGTSR